ncbi:ribosomal-protein-alanine N-acetyltransferase [Bacillus sp. THAF10]|uniref:GNAT family N-acetyltransferase n=1 Tax=Bacillus sp. THAF10 TaxID=2587848 RepID=UPI0012678491|nr:GNAT family N-acetyltransferase [Bacillus sp. THAF10]QFT88117.1 ribosomal-protein-alanine N-acetyltransferase [Bacillus sp. THAF10]
MTGHIVSTPSRDTIEEVAAFIATLNKTSSHHIGYCGKNKQELAFMLKSELEVPYEQSFLLAYDKDTLIGVIGFDADLQQHSAEILGPFVAEPHSDFASELYFELEKYLPEQIHAVSLFPDRSNTTVTALAEKASFSKKSEQAILTKQKSESTVSYCLEELPSYLHTEFTRLHDLAFPHTYYSGEEIIQRINENRKVFVVEENKKLAGYIYVEIEPNFGEASIEFFAVDAIHQGKGIGAQLLLGAVNWIFSFDSILSLQLCVEATNEKALRIYERVGFHVDHQLHYYVKKLEIIK